MTVVPGREVQSLFVIYDADGTRTGEIIYITKKLLGLAHCAACDITHGPRREKPEFTQLKLTWPVPVYNIHRDEMDKPMAAAVQGELPCVVARTADGDVIVMREQELEECAGDVLAFASRVKMCVQEAGLSMPEKVQSCGLRIRGTGERKEEIDEVGSVSSNGDAVVPGGLF